MNHKRSIYNFFDLLGDIGGLFDALKIISGFLISLNFAVFGDPMNQFLLQALFLRQKRNPNREPAHPKDTDRVSELRGRNSFRLRQVLFACLRSSREKRMIEKGTGRID